MPDSPDILTKLQALQASVAAKQAATVLAYRDEDRERWQEAFNAEQSTTYAAADALPLAIEEIQRLRRASDFATEWYGRRWNRLRHLIHNQAPHLEETACCIMANGTASHDERPIAAPAAKERE